MQELRDYLYLDLQRLEDYLSILEPTGEVRQLVETIHNERIQTVSVPKFGEPANEGSTQQGGKTTERTMSVSAKHAFNRLYEKLSGSIIDIDETPEAVKKGFAIEVSRNFKVSPIAHMIDSLPQVLQTIIHDDGPELDEEVQRQISLKLEPLLKSPDVNHHIPIIATGPHYSVVFSADPRYLLRGAAEMAGDLTLVGKAKKIIPDGQELNLLKLPNVLPPGIQQIGLDDDDLFDLFEDWPEELDSGQGNEALTIAGPIVVVDALAVYA